MEQKGCDSVGCWTHYVTLSHDLDLRFSWSTFGKAVSLECGGRLTWNERDVSHLWCSSWYMGWGVLSLSEHFVISTSLKIFPTKVFWDWYWPYYLSLCLRRCIPCLCCVTLVMFAGLTSNLVHNLISHFGLVGPCSIINLDQHWFRSWLVAF